MSELKNEQAQADVLIVEDEPAIADLFRTLLRMEGFAAHVAPNNSTALAFLEETTPEVVLLDVMMPGESGLDLCRYIRQTPGLEDLPVIVVSARTQSSDVNAGMEAGADAYLQKPVSNNALVETVRRCVRRNFNLPSGPQKSESLETEVEKTLIEVRRYIAEINRAERAYEDFVSGLEARPLSLAERQARVREAAKMYRRQIKLTQAAGWGVFEQLLEKLELREFAIRRRGQHQPDSVDDWQTAAARAQFVREDCQNWAASSPQQILLEYQGALADGDQIYAYLLERYGQDSLEAVNDWETLSELRSYISKVNQPDPQELADVQALYDKVNPLRAKLSSIRPPDALILVRRPEGAVQEQQAELNPRQIGHHPQNGSSPAVSQPMEPSTQQAELSRAE